MQKLQFKHRCFCVMLTLLLLVGIAPTMQADKWEYGSAQSFTAYEKAPGVIHFKVLVARKAANSSQLWLSGCGTYNGTATNGISEIFISTPGSADERIIHFYSYLTGSFGDNCGLYELHLGNVGMIADKGAFVFTQTIASYDKNNQYGTHSKEMYRISKVLNSNGEEKATFAEFDWYMPKEYIGRDPSSFKVSVQCKGVKPRSDTYYYYSDVTNDRTYSYTLLENVSFPNTQVTSPELMEPNMAMDMGDGVAKPGQMMINMLNPQYKIHSYTLPGESEVKLATPNNMAILYIPISDAVRKNYKVQAKCVYNGDILPVGKDTFERYNFYTATTNSVTIPAYHMIHNLQADWNVDSVGLRNGDVRITWEIYNPSDKDIMETDMFIIERATKADFSDVQQINMQYFESGKAQYEFIDESDEIKQQNSTEGKFYYRVRRASTSIWTNMDEVIQSGLAAEAILRYDSPKTQAEREEDILAGIHKQTAGYEILSPQFNWSDSTHFDFTFVSTIDLERDAQAAGKNLSLDFYYRIGSTKAIYQPTVDSCVAKQSSDWITSRKVEVSAIVPKIKLSYRDHDCQYGTISIVERSSIYYKYLFSPSLESIVQKEPDENNIYWDKDRTMLYLVRRMITGTDTTEMEIPVSVDDIKYNPEKQQYEIHTIDVADVPCTRYEYYFRVDASNSPLPVGGESVSQLAQAESQFYFNDGMRMVSVQASDRTSPNFTSLHWETEGGDFEEYEIWRTNEDGTTQWNRVATVKAYNYLDRTAPVGVPCLYKVVGLLNCDGTLSDTSIVVHGQRDCYGSISGHVTYTNGSVRPGTVIHFASSTNGSIIDSVVTDENGYYYKDSLLFTYEGMSYDVLVPGDVDGAFLSASGARLPLHVTLNGKEAIITDVNIQYTRCQRMEGRVLYEYSTVPVPHVQFMLDGRLIKDLYGNPIETDASGNFDLMVESGKHTIQAVKDGHTFANNGFFTDENGNKTINFTESLYGKRLFDLTRIRVVGRVTGGLTEGTKLLGLGRSVNTLGDNLTLTFELEGDNISRFVYYPTRSDITERDTVFRHIHTGDSTTMHMTAKRITVHPDPRSGEFVVELFPARYKVTQAYANGYATLFPAGMTSQAIDMSDATHIEGYIDTLNTPRPLHIPYHYAYQITYRNPINLQYQQLVYGIAKDYLGEEKMQYSDIMRTDTTINLVMRDSLNNVTGYVFGYPVFSSQYMRNKYTFRIFATEDYYYNNDQSSARHWQEYIVGNNVTVFNGMNTNNETHSAYIDPVTRYATVEVEVNNPSFVLTGEDALRQIEMGMQVDGLYVYAQPIRGYVTGTRAKGIETLQALDDELTLLDVIRDPYGANSYSYVEAGTTYHASYRTDWDVTVGLNININTGPDVYQSLGTVAAPMGVGAYTGTVALKQKTEISADLPIQFRFVYYNNADYSFTTTERIQTSSDPLMVGAMADIYVGTMNHRYAGLVDAVTIIDSTQYRLLQPAIQSGKVHVLSVPQDSTPYYLVVGEQTELGRTRPVEFVYTQKHIIDHVLPRLIQSRNALLMTGSHEELQAIANATDTCVYRTLVNVDDPLYGLSGGYEWIKPSKRGIYVDDIARYNALMKQWMLIIAQNEKDKVEAQRMGDLRASVSLKSLWEQYYSFEYNQHKRDSIARIIKEVSNDKYELLNTYSVTSGADISYHESTSYSHASDFHWRYTSLLSGVGGGALSFVGQVAGKYVSKAYEAIKSLTNFIESKEVKTTTSIMGFEVVFDPSVILDPKINTAGTSTFGNNKTAGFVLSASDNSYEDISVYRVTDDKYNSDNKDVLEVAFKDISDDNQGGSKYADYVFIRRGGATHCPYEDEETTLFYSVGNKPVQLAAPTLHIDRPALSINVREQSNVPMDQPATFVLTISNESDITYDPNIPSPMFLLRQDQNTNPDGLIIKIDGQPIMNGLTFPLGVGESIQKTMQVYRGTAYDYDSIRLILRPECDINLVSDISFNVHYQPVSCPVSMTLPVQNWIMNTLSPKDETGYYLPVEISGFDIHYDNFDHIDFQYKLKTQSDDQWTTQCSFYADSALYNLASGNKAMIDNGQIRNVRFYGERDPIEQNYDLRAVSYCRLGNEFITRSSELHSGLKDTRVPQLFGVASPANGILQVGDYIGIPFSENIAANYLDEDYNFEVVGYTNESKINKSSSLTFEGGSETNAMTELNYNLSNKDFSVDLWVMPARRNQEMTYIMQGNRDTYIGFGQSYDPATGINRLGVHMADPTQDGYMLSEPINITTDDWMHVVATYKSEDGQVELYLNGKKVTAQLENYPSCLPYYEGVGPIILGAHPAWPSSYFEGKMMEVRIWNKVLSPAEIERTNLKQISGYENALEAYYPFDEGQGMVAADKVGGANMLLNGLTWTKQEGRALELNNMDLRLKGGLFSTSRNADFTYSMWFRIMEKADSINLFNSNSLQLTLTPSDLRFVTISTETMTEHEPVVAHGTWMDQQWHFLAVTANHSTGVGNVYVDNNNVAQFNCYDVQGSDTDTPVIGPMKGQIDDVTFWEMALPEYYLQNFYRHTPNNTEMGLLVHLGFSERVLSDDGDHYLTRFNPYNERIRKDELGNILPRTEDDRVVVNAIDMSDDDLVDNAPIHDKGDLVKLGFNWLGKDNELVINLKTLDKEINKQNIFVTVRNVEDLAGNPQQSPLCWTLFVDRNRLRWSEKYLQTTLYQGESANLTLDILNQSGVVTNYYIEQLPWWLTASAERGELSPLEQIPLTLHVSENLDPGEYTTIIYLTDDNELSESLHIQIHVKARQPKWNVNPESSNGQTMNMFAQVQFVGAKNVEYLDTDTADIVAAFLGNTCIGVEHIMTQKGRSLLCMSMQGSNNPSFIEAQRNHQSIRFLLWRASTGKIYALSPADPNLKICYEPDTWVGRPDAPVLLHTTDYRTQQIELQKGWNWISFYIEPDRSGRDFSDALTADYTFHNGDFIKRAHYSQSYEDGEWIGTRMHFYNDYTYMIRVSEAGRVGVQGFTLNQEQRSVGLHYGWNNLPYFNETTQDIDVALASYRKNGKPGDVVKGYRTFAMLDENRQWVGSLTHMQPGMGYMLYRQDSSFTTMQYQNGGKTNKHVISKVQSMPDMPLRFSHNMPLVATVTGAEEGDRLMAYEDNQLVGTAEADSLGRFLMMTSANEGSRLRFCYISNQGVQNTAPLVCYQSSNPSIGTLEHPYLITFGTNMAAAYPDPFTDHITYSGVATEAGNVEITLYNANGQCMWSHTLDNVPAGTWQYTQWGTGNYPQGIYIAVIRVAGTNTQVKLIKE